MNDQLSHFINTVEQDEDKRISMRQMFDDILKNKEKTKISELKATVLIGIMSDIDDSDIISILKISRDFLESVKLDVIYGRIRSPLRMIGVTESRSYKEENEPFIQPVKHYPKVKHRYSSFFKCFNLFRYDRLSDEI